MIHVYHMNSWNKHDFRISITTAVLRCGSLKQVRSPALKKVQKTQKIINHVNELERHFVASATK